MADPSAVTFHAVDGPASLAFVRPELRRGAFVCRVELTDADTEAFAVDLDMIRAYSAALAAFFAELPSAVSAGRTTSAESEFGEFGLRVHPGDPAVFEVRLWWRDLGDERIVKFAVSQSELRRRSLQMPRFLGE